MDHTPADGLDDGALRFAYNKLHLNQTLLAFVTTACMIMSGSAHRKS